MKSYHNYSRILPNSHFMKPLLTVLAMLAAGLLHAQDGPAVRSCAADVPGKAWDDWFNGRVEAFKNRSAQKEQVQNYVIPVVFHIIHGGQSVGSFPNISQAQVLSQITILNNDYAGKGFNVENFLKTNFNPQLVADCNISFCLAEKDPSGAVLAEKGIDRVNYNQKGLANPISFTTPESFRNYMDNTVKPVTIWNPARYLNIWVSDVSSVAALLGYATFPPASGLPGIPGVGNLLNDGVWCWTKAIGDVGSVSAFYNKGRTATHEIGHYLGLRHIWGDATCGTDYCNDTPAQSRENTDCPSFPHVSCNNGPNGDLFMNFMDYCPDACLYMFTADQRTRMHTALTNSPLRSQLAVSAANLCSFTPAVCSYTAGNLSAEDTLQPFRRATTSLAELQCPQGTGKAGYITGSNCRNDMEKAEFISASQYNTLVAPHVKSVIVLFYQSPNAGTKGKGDVGIRIYSGMSESSQPGILLGSMQDNLGVISAGSTTTSVPYGRDADISLEQPVILPYKFNFSNPVPVPADGGFYASLVLPALAEDTVVIMDKRTGTVNTAWEKWSNATWHDMRTTWGGSRNFNLAILPVIECGLVGIGKNSLLENAVDLFPNPSDGKFTLVTTFAEAQVVQIQVYNTLGQTVLKEELPAGQHVLDIHLEHCPAGLYFVDVSNGREKVTKKLLVSK